MSDLKKYAYAFDIPVSNLLQTIVIEGNENKLEEDQSKQPIIIKQTRTENPFVVITKIELSK